MLAGYSSQGPKESDTTWQLNNNDFFFYVDHFLKSLLNLLHHCFCFVWVFYAESDSTWDLGSLTRDQTCDSCIGL